jgi:hypothetical protein
MTLSPGSELCFTMSVVDELGLVRSRVARIRSAYPTARVVLLVDPVGSSRVPLAAWSRRIHAEVRSVLPELYAVGRGGHVVQEHLDTALEGNARWWFKVDPDTVVRRALTRLPADECFFGTLQGGAPGPSLQGGCIGGTRGAVEHLATSGALLSPKLSDFASTWARGNPNLLDRGRAGFVSFDFVHAWACRELGIVLRDHPEIRSEWRQPPADPDRYAITHPHKLLDEDAERRVVAERASIAERVVAMMRERVPGGARVAVVSKGDERLMTLDGRTIRHFPSIGEKYAGFHPCDSEHAVSLLERERERGAEYFVIPATALWWLDHYTGLARHLEMRYRLLASREGTGAIWSLGGSP